jgi:hyperosmotically inducible protein
MISKYVKTLVVIGALLAPLASHAKDSPKVWIKDSVITVKIKAEYAKDKQVSVKRIRVDTDASGFVRLSGTARSRSEANKAVAIAKNVEGVVSVNDRIKVAPKKA